MKKKGLDNTSLIQRWTTCEHTLGERRYSGLKSFLKEEQHFLKEAASTRGLPGRSVA